MAGAFLLAMVGQSKFVQLGAQNKELFGWITATYLLIAIISNLSSYFQWPDLAIQGVGYSIIDFLNRYYASLKSNS